MMREQFAIAMVALAYLCSVKNHQTRVWSESGQRLRCQFPKRHWFMTLVHQQGLQEHLSRRNATATFRLEGLMTFNPGIAAEDVLSEYPAREELQIWKHFWACQGSLYTVLACECFVFQEVQDIYTYSDVRNAEPQPLRGRRNALSPFLPANCQTEHMLGLPGTLLQCGGRGEGQTAMSVRDVLARWGLELTDQTLAVPVSEPIASLLSRGFWCSIGLLGPWSLPKELFEDEQFPPDELSELVYRPEEHWSSNLSYEKVSCLVQRVRSWAPLLLQNPSGDDDDNNLLRLELADTVQWFDTLKDNMEHQGRPARYSSHVMIASVFLSMMLATRRRMAEVIPLALKLALPGLDFGDLAKHIHFPRTTTLARAATYLDFAYMMLCREDFKREPHLLYVWADSSPQGGREWFMSMHACVAQGSVVDTFKVVNQLIRARPDLADHVESEELDFDELMHCNSTLQANLWHHKNIPVAMGSGRTRLEDKTSCLLHAMALESASRDDLAHPLKHVVAVTSDMGTELQLGHFHSLNPEDLLPTWLHAADFSGDDVQELPSDDDVSQPQRPQPLPQQNPVSDEPQPVMPSCLTVAGCLHIFHNLISDLHTKMEWFNEFWDQLKDIAELLADRHLRDRFIHQCIRGSAAAHFEGDFNLAGVSKLYEKRWQVLVKCLDALMPLLDPLRQAWNYGQFRAGGGGNIEATCPAGVEKALNSALFIHYLHMVYGVHKLLTNFEQWLESCPCHHQDQDSGGFMCKGRKRRSKSETSLKQSLSYER